jgi:hypothetical protein
VIANFCQRLHLLDGAEPNDLMFQLRHYMWVV